MISFYLLIPFTYQQKNGMLMSEVVDSEQESCLLGEQSCPEEPEDF
jgi:hypothetical protein